jgi:hypothetical protein
MNKLRASAGSYTYEYGYYGKPSTDPGPEEKSPAQ